MKKINKFFKNKKGSFSIEAVLAMSGLLMITFLGIAYFTYLVPRQMLTQEVHMLTQTAKIQGGLTAGNFTEADNDIQRFLDRMEEKGFDPNKINIKATVSSETNPIRDGVSVIGVEPLSDGYKEDSLYSHRNSKEIITIRVTIPANKNFINAMSKYWTGSKEGTSLGDYKFTETIMSERW